MLYDENQGHDALVESVVFDAAAGIVSVKLLAYPRADSGDRKAIEIRFSDVDSVNLAADLQSLDDNRSAGNVAYWHIARGAGTSFFYLIEGYLAITARAAPELLER
jgi:hypothetical protein